jgi:hypothetical protein
LDRSTEIPRRLISGKEEEKEERINKTENRRTKDILNLKRRKT